MMSAPKSTILSCMGQVFEVFKVIVAAIFNLGGSPDDELAKVRKNSQLAKKIAEMIMNFGKEVKQGELAQSYVELFNLLKELGRFDYKNDDITPEHFPNEVLPSIDALMGAQVVHLGRSASTTDVEEHLKKLHLRPATFFELLLWAILHPEEQRKYPIIALGSSWASARGALVAFLCGYAAGRDLDLVCVAGVWNGDCRFLALSIESLEG